MDMARFSTARAPRRAAHGISRVALCLLIGGLLVALGAVASSAYANEPEDFSGGAYQILAPGDGGAPPFGPELLPTVPSSTVDQGMLYDALTPLGGNVTQANLETLYLSEKFGVTGPILGEEPTASLLAQLGGLGTGLVIKRDQHNI